MSARPWYATNARDLLEARRNGMAPAGPVVVSLIGGAFGKLAAATLYVNEDVPVERLDWRMLVNLEVWLWADAGTPLERLLQLLDGIARARPRRLCLRFDQGAETHDIDLGSGYHMPTVGDLPAVHEFHWAPLALNYTPIERRLCQAARVKHARGTVL